MGTVVQLMGNKRYSNALMTRSLPTVLVAICFLIIANTRCDQVGSANVQKFHPNGRYGRSFGGTQAHSELGLDNGGLGSILHSGLRDTNKHQFRNNEIGDSTERKADLDLSSNMDYQLEANKLLKCNYTGVSNLYWCDSGN